MKNEYFIEVTDLFGGEANYSWLQRFMVSATSERGAMRKVGARMGNYWRKTLDCGDFQRWDSGGICAFVQSPDNCGMYKVETL